MSKRKERKFKRPRMWSHPRLLIRQLLRRWPLLVWLAAILVILYLQSEVVQYGNLAGVVYSREQDVAPPETARIASIDVEMGQVVQVGDVLVRMDTSLIDARIEAAKALAIEDEETISRYQESILRMARQFETAVTDARTTLMSVTMEQMQSQAELAALRRELQRREGLLEQRLIREEEVAILRPQIAALAKAVEAYPELIAAHEDALDSAKSELVDMRKWLRLEEGETISDAIARKRDIRIAVLANEARVLELQRESYTLTASQAGEVARMNHSEGEVVTAGDPVLRIVSPDARFVIGFLKESQLASVAVGDTVSVWRRGNERDRVNGVVESLAPEVRGLPGVAVPLPGQVIRGRRMMVRLTEDHNLIPGESVQIVSGAPSWARTIQRVVDRFRRETPGAGK